ncbi:MBL fold metallo-hydrolase [Aeromicrobium duanguangcaii]|uniref:MBL fold metallo-hydrolase n=1 Tax=Aeromicrobium duanguangcaii TaxID=2968086 RepID=A0ABY5KED8_9ACTN|nr:MBL fold metallo-hydrolase [Aeromicrobium duanguangcaii]MCD9154105.1 MBL fold metallo-hydrolase [Aeromicrobium duanguangcaii]UUI68822.1 MBL fold metallo-hydrolase [Aeromicrobium duanguangcaii]
MGIEHLEPGIVRIEDADTNCYLIELGDLLMFVDAGFPRTWRYAQEALAALGRTPDEVTDVVLTHAHFDHLGFAAKARRESGARVWVHPGDHRIAAHPYRYRPGRPRLFYPLRYPAAAPILARMVRAGALRVEGVEQVDSLGVGSSPDGITVVPTAGHTDGHCVLHIPALDVVLTGDALVTLDPYTGRRGPRIVARAGTKDAVQARRSLERIAATDASLVLPGHGEPWTQGAASAVASARRSEVA